MERRGQRARQRRDRKRECVREGGWLREEVVSALKVAAAENRPFGIRIGSERRINLIAAKHFNDRNILLDYEVFLETVGMIVVVSFLHLSLPLFNPLVSKQLWHLHSGRPRALSSQGQGFKFSHTRRDREMDKISRKKVTV